MTRLAKFVRHGPPDEGGTLSWMLGMWLWWRMWATMACIALPLFAGFVLLAETTPMFAVMGTWFIATFAATWQMKLSPKYEVTKNY